MLSTRIKAIMRSFILLALAMSFMQLAAEPKIVVQGGHTNGTFAVALSPDGRFLVSGSEDSLLKLWDIASGKEMRTFAGHSNWVLSVAFSPDGKRVYSSSRDCLIKAWDVQSGKDLLTFTGHNSWVNSIALSPDGKFLVSCAENTELFLWDTVTGQKIREFKGHDDDIQAVAYSPDGTRILSAGKDKVLKLWDVNSGKCISTMGALFGHKKTVQAVAFSPDGKYAASGSEDNTALLWDLSKSSLVRQFEKKHKDYNSITGIAFSPDGKSVASSSWSGYLTLWDVKTGKAKYFKQMRAAGRQIVFSKDGTTIASGCALTPTLSDAASGLSSRDFLSYGAILWSGDLSADEKQVIVPSYDKSLKFWDIENGTILRTIVDSDFQICDSAIFAPNNSDILFTEGPRLYLFAPEAKGEQTWKLLWEQDHTQVSTIHASAFSPDGKTVLTGSYDSVLKLWDRATGTLIRPLSGHSGNINDAAFSPNGKMIASNALGQPVLILWDAASGKMLDSSLPDEKFGLGPVCFTPDGKRLVTVSRDGGLIEVNTAARNISATWNADLTVIESLDISSDSRFALTGHWDGSLALWRLGSGGLLRRYPGNSAKVTSVGFFRDGKRAFSSSTDGTMKIWNLDTGEWTAFVANADGTQWIVYTNDGYWDASATGGQMVAMVDGQRVWNIDQFAARNNRPDIILERLGSADTERIAHYKAQYLKRLRRLGLSEASLSDSYGIPAAAVAEAKARGKFVDLKLTFTADENPLARYNIYVNDVPIYGSYGKALVGTSAEVAASVELTTGDNKIEVGCIDSGGAESYRAVHHARYDAAPKGDLYYIGFGVSKYKNVPSLRFADKDAQDLAALCEKMSGSFGAVHARAFVNEEVTTENIRKAKELLKSAKPEDTLILFIAGHGIHDTDPESTYYFLTYDADLSRLGKTAAEFELVEDILQGIEPRNKLFLMDTCESGDLDPGEQATMFAQAGSRGILARTARGLSVVSSAAAIKPREYLIQKDRFIYNDLARRSGAIVFSSCRGGEFSYESEEYANGFFTRAVIDALKGSSGTKNAVLGTDDLRAYVIQAVARLSGDLQHPTVDRDNLYQKFGFPIVK